MKHPWDGRKQQRCAMGRQESSWLKQAFQRGSMSSGGGAGDETTARRRVSCVGACDRGIPVRRVRKSRTEPAPGRTLRVHSVQQAPRPTHLISVFPLGSPTTSTTEAIWGDYP